MEHPIDRRTLCKTMGLGLGAACLSAPLAEAAPKRRLKIGHTSITWGFKPADAEPGIRDSAKLGYHGYESLGEVVEAWEQKGGLGRILDENKMPLPSTYCSIHLTDPSRRNTEVEKIIRWGKEINQAGLSWITILKKAENFRKAYHNFDIARVAKYGQKDFDRLLSDSGIIRNRLKINAAIVNAQKIRELQKEHGSFAAWLDPHHPLSREEWTKLFKKTFVFTGGEIVNEFLVSTGYLQRRAREKLSGLQESSKFAPRVDEGCIKIVKRSDHLILQ